MSNGKLLQQIGEDLDVAIASTLAKRDASAPNDCYETCHKAYDDCMASAGSDAEKLACKAKYNRCITNC